MESTEVAVPEVQIPEVTFYTHERQCPVCLNEINNFSTVFPVSHSWCGTSRKFKVTTCGHPVCSNCYESMVKAAAEEEPPTTPNCPICRFEAHHFLKLDMEHSYLADLMTDNYSLQCELRQVSLYSRLKRREACYYKLKSLVYLVLLREEISESASDTAESLCSELSSSEMPYINETKEFQDCDMSDQNDDRPITSRYHRRNLLRRRQEGGLESDLRNLYNDSSRNENESDSSESEPTISEATNDNTRASLPRVDADWQQSINDICAVVINRLDRLHTRVAILESKETSQRLDTLKRNYELKKYETVLLENEISELKKRYMETASLNIRNQHA